jgi:hypothetical protein
MQSRKRKIWSNWKNWKAGKQRKVTRLNQKSSLAGLNYTLLGKEPYILINLVFAGVIVLVFIYSGIFSPDKDNYPIICIHEKITGLPCFSCGLSHSFSLILRGRIDEAYQWNIYGLRVFLFFLAQLAMRITFSINYISDKSHRRELILYDIAGSIIIFLVAFYPFFRQLFLFLIS